MASLSDVKNIVSQKFLDHVDKRMESFKCGAHDFAHVKRVANIALHIANKEEAKKPDDV